MQGNRLNLTGLTLAAFALSLLAACANPFSTREPEPPEQNQSGFINPSIPEIVFINLQLAFQERNVENYMRSFVDTTRSQNRFVFVPDRGVAATNPGTFDNWTLENERLYLFQLFQATPAGAFSNLQFTEQSRTEGPDMATFTQNYEIEVRHSLQANNVPTVFRGQSKFWLEKDQTGAWAVYRWEDFTNGVDPSWSELKVLFQ
ncbi:MAG: hypothetical protein D6743_05445 [Calditrichaeota bacterium]|nr:MAG: hypothetical protein D6743_05445 [Calditrichota bacterium]